MQKLTTLLCLTLFCTCMQSHVSAQDTLRVLFLGNSYTGANNLPSLVSQFAEANGDVVITAMNTPGGHTLDQHATNASSLSHIAQGNWDYVILQDQSQVPTIDYFRYNFMYPAVENLKEIISEQNPCAKTVMFMTWGRQNGGMQCSSGGVYCSVDFEDFSHMTDTLASAYTEIGEMVGAMVAPVGKAWDEALTYSTSNLVLHAGDGSHPNYSGSYLAAAVFHGLIWDESPVGNTFSGSLNINEATYLQQSAFITLGDYADLNLAGSNDCVLVTYGNTLVYETYADSEFQWFDSENQLIVGANSNTYNATVSGTYTIEVLSSSGCILSCSAEIEVNGVEQAVVDRWEWVDSSTLRINQSDKYRALITSINGQIVYDHSFVGDLLSLPSLPQGLYLVTIASDGGASCPFFAKIIR
jgi:hypothetical protein